MKSINRFLIKKGIKSNTQKITILQMVKWVDEWQNEIKTPMQILLSELNQFPEGREALKNTRWEELLEKEKQMIINAYMEGSISLTSKMEAEQYYNETFKQ